MKKYPKDMKIKTLTKDCFYEDTETSEGVIFKEKYIKRFKELAHDFAEDCIKNQIETTSQTGFFIGWLFESLVEAQLDASYNYLEEVKQ